MFRHVVLLLVAYPLLLPPGMCICGTVRLSEYGHADSSLPRCGQTKINCHPCSDSHGMPTEKQCPPSCPASKQADHSKLAEKRPVVTAWAAAIIPQTVCVDAFPSPRLPLPSFLSQPLAEPLYITLCMLLI
jgi:hypothetical protein